MALNTNKKEGDKLHAEEWNELVQELQGKQSRLNIVDALDSTSSVDVLSAKQGKILNDKINSTLTSVETISEKVAKLPYGIYYGQYDDVESLPDAGELTQKGYAYVASTDPSIFYIYTYEGEGDTWQDSGNKFDSGSLESNLSTKSQTKAPTTKAVQEGIEAADITKQKTESTELSNIQKYNAASNINNRAVDINVNTGKVKALGYKVLNSQQSFISQVVNTDTIYEIKDEFDCTGQTVLIPNNCTLYFNGGRIVGGTINLNNVILNGEPLIVGCTLSGMIKNQQITPQVFGAKGDGETNDTAAIRDALKVCNYVRIPKGKYPITEYWTIAYLGRQMVQNLGNAICITRDNVTLHLDDGAELFVANIDDESGAAAANAFTAIIYVLGSRTISGTNAETAIVTDYTPIKNVVIEGGTFTGNRSFFSSEDFDEHIRENYVAIACAWTDGLTIKNTKITDNSGDAIYCAPTWNTVIENVETARNRRCSVAIGCTDGFNVKRCYFHDEKQSYTYSNGNTNTGIDGNGIIVIEPEPRPFVNTLEVGETEKNVIIEDNVYDAKNWSLFFQGAADTLIIRNNKIINITRRTLAKPPIIIVRGGPQEASAKTSLKNVFIEKNTFEATNLTQFYKNTNSTWYYNKYYSKNGDNYELLESKPTGWSSNYGNYYYKTTGYTPNTNSTWTPSFFYEKIDDLTYTLLRTQPSGWNENYNTYYQRSTIVCTAIRCQILEGTLIIAENVCKGLGICELRKNESEIYIKNNTSDWFASIAFTANNALNGNTYITDNNTACNLFISANYTSTARTDKKILIQGNKIISLESIIEDSMCLAYLPVAEYIIQDNDIESNLIGILPSTSTASSVLNIVGNSITATTGRTSEFNMFAGSSADSAKRIWNGLLENNIFNLPTKLTLAKSASGSTAKLVYKNNIFNDNVNDANIIPSSANNVYSSGNIALHVAPKKKVGTSSERPILTANDISFVYFDTDLGKPIYWNGTAWIDGNGEPVGLQVNDTTVLIGASTTDTATINIYYGGSTPPTINILNADDTPCTWLTASPNPFTGNTLTLTPNNANTGSNPRGCKVIITLGDEVKIVNVVQNYSTT